MKQTQDTHGLLNIAQIWCGSQTLGPGLRSIVWVQGCLRQCCGCISPEWRPLIDAWLISPEDLAEILLENPDITGLPISGGEPMLQAKLLSKLARYCRAIREIDLICYSGYTLEELRSQPEETGIADFLAEIDVLIDGQYLAALNDDLGLRGSSNQRIHYLTDRLKKFDFETLTRSIELHTGTDSIVMIGIPSKNMLNTLNRTFLTTGAQTHVSGQPNE
jgi:anaerobic ribonucleoside-triphosphate reductase activating protein